MGKLIIKEKVRCSRCNGRGRVFNVEECVCTAGISFVLGLIDRNMRDVCPECDGEGWIFKETEIVEQ